MTRIDNLLTQAIKAAGPKPADDAPQGEKNPWVGKLSNNLALALADELRHRGMTEARPAGPGDVGLSGAERRLAGGIGAKRVDVSWATEESGLMLACSVKTIMFRDRASGNFQKNLINRRGDLTVEAVTLHHRFPSGNGISTCTKPAPAASAKSEPLPLTCESVLTQPPQPPLVNWFLPLAGTQHGVIQACFSYVG